MSSNFGGAGDTVPAASASRNIVLQNGHAAPTMFAPGRHQFLRAIVTDALAFFFAQEREPAAGAATEAALARTRRIDHFAGPRKHCARLVIDVAIAAQVAGIVIDDLVAVSACGSWS